MKIRSCIKRYFRYIIQSGACSALTLFINSDLNVRKFRIQIVATLILAIMLMVDSYCFGMYFGKFKHVKWGVVYPYAMFTVTSYITHFIIKTGGWKYLYLPFDVLEGFGYSRILSLTTVHAVYIGLITVCLYLGCKKFYKINA